MAGCQEKNAVATGCDANHQIVKDMSTKDYVNEFLSNSKGWVYETPPGIGNQLINRTLVVLKDGTSMSIQASKYHYCEPRDNHGPYTQVEVGFPNRLIPEILEFAEDQDSPKDTVYGYVPVDVLNEVIKKAGGRINSHELADAYNERNDLKQQRDDLLAALNGIIDLASNEADALSDLPESEHYEDAEEAQTNVAKAREVIARVEGKQ